MKPIDRRWFWFYDDWLGTRPSFGGDEYGCHTLVIPLGKRRALCVAFWPCYLFDKECRAMREETLKFYQDMFYVQTYWNTEELDDVCDLSNEEWDQALGLVKFRRTNEETELRAGSQVC